MRIRPTGSGLVLVLVLVLALILALVLVLVLVFVLVLVLILRWNIPYLGKVVQPRTLFPAREDDKEKDKDLD